MSFNFCIDIRSQYLRAGEEYQSRDLPCEDWVMSDGH